MATQFNNKKLCIIDIDSYAQSAMKDVNYQKFAIFEYDSDGNHDRTYSSLKIIIMDKVIKKNFPEADYILSLDADTIFTGNILKKTKEHLYSTKYIFDIYMVQRKDKRMQMMSLFETGSGYLLWKRNSNFIKLFISKFNKSYTNLNGGSQELINEIKTEFAYHEIDDPLLHFISPDTKNPNITDKEILELQPAYIHLHGKNSYERLLKFERIFS
jgi:hypothetical protein